MSLLFDNVSNMKPPLVNSVLPFRLEALHLQTYKHRVHNCEHLLQQHRKNVGPSCYTPDIRLGLRHSRSIASGPAATSYILQTICR